MRTARGFTLIELLIVVAIIAILGAIAVPNFLEAQTRAKVSRAKADMRAIATALDHYRVDHNAFPNGTDNPVQVDQRIVDMYTPLGLPYSYYTFQTRAAGGRIVGRDFANITTPVAYISSFPTDVFAGQAASWLTYCYRPARTGKNGYVLTSFGPDGDHLLARGTGDMNNPLGTQRDPWYSPRLGDANEQAVCYAIEFETGQYLTAADIEARKSFAERLTYDPTNGTVSDGDILRVQW